MTALTSQPRGGLPLSLLADLMGQIRCDAVSFEGLDSNVQTEWFWQGIPDWDEDDEDLNQADQVLAALLGLPALRASTPTAAATAGAITKVSGFLLSQAMA